MLRSVYFQGLLDRSNQMLERLLNQQESSHLLTAMRYVVLNGGKRLRPVLTYAIGDLLGVDLNCLDLPACAIELIHAYSLVHDDLPAMDNDDFRRGKPSCHKAFDEATAILVGDALQTLAFEILSQPDQKISAAQSLQLIATLAKASGVNGMAGGQDLDLQGSSKTLDLPRIEKLYQLKTGALFSASIELALIAAGELSREQAQSLREFGRCFGLAFQIQDDIHDVEGDIATLGKEPGSDRRQEKSTYVAVAGMENAKLTVQSLRQKTLASLDMWQEKAEQLRLLTEFLLAGKLEFKISAQC